MKNIVFASLLTLGASSLLAGCGLIPAQTVQNPLGLKDVSLTSSTLSSTSSSVSTRVAGSGTATANASFADIAALPLTPGSISIAMALKGVTYSAGCLAAANGVTVTLSNFKVDLSDGAGATHNFSATLPTFSLNVSSAGIISGIPAGALNFVIANVPLVTDILTKAPTPNTVNVTTDIATVPALSGCTITFTFDGGTGTIGF